MAETMGTVAVDSAVAGGNDTGVVAGGNDTVVVMEASWLCGTAGPLWNHTLSWDTKDENPDLTRCLRSAMWSFPPFILFYVLLPIHTRELFRSQSRNVPISHLSVAKVVALVILIAVTVMDLCFWLMVGDEVNLIDVADPVLRLVTFAPLLVLLFVERARGLRISNLQFLTFLLFVATSLLPFYSRIKQLAENSDGTFTAVTFLVSFACIVASFLCHFFVEKKPTYTGPSAPEDTPNPCPEILASCPSRLFFSWFTGLAWTGMKRPLVAEDLWDLNPIIASRKVVQKFNRHWEKLSNSISFIKSSGRLNNASFNRNADNVEIVPNKKEKSKYRINIFPSLLKAFGFSFLFGSLFKLVHDLMVFAQPVLQQLIIQFAKDDSKPLWQGIAYAVVLLVATSAQTIILSQYFYRMYLIGIWVRAAVTSAIYRKALRVSQASKREVTTGEVVNLMSVDVQRLVDMMPYLNMIWSAPMQIVLALGFLWLQLGPSVLAGVLVMVLLIPVNGAIAAKSRTYQMQQMKQKDQRVKMMNEILQGMKILKLFAWEESFQKVVSDIRDKEIRILTKNAYLQAGSGFVWAAAPFVVSLVTFATYVLSDENNVLDSEKAFVSLTLFNILRFPMSMLPMMIAAIVQSTVSIKRINKFMNSEEVDAKAIENQDGGDVAMKMEDASFSWDREAETPTIKNVSVDVKKGQLVAVVGTVGCGKSSLISSFLGELEKIDGRVIVNGRVAYVAQQAWIMNETLKNNILFNQPYDEPKYKSCIEACALDPDLKMLPGGDETEIGEKGINLSGGQKQRVSLARACYSNADIYLLDDPLSAVDAHVGKHIFEQVIGGGLLKDKTRVLVTHGVGFLPQVDKIIVLKDGQISEVGTYQELMDSKGAFAEFLVQYLTAEGSDNVEDSDQIAAIKSTLEQTMGKEELQRNISRLRSRNSETAGSQPRLNRGDSVRSNGSGHSAATPTKNGSLKSKESSPVKKGVSRSKSRSADKGLDKTAAANAQGGGGGDKKEQQYQEEKREAGNVKMTVYSFYLKSLGYVYFGSCFFFFVIFQLASSGSSIWLQIWSDDALAGDKRDLYLGGYGAFGVAQVFTVVAAALLLYTSTLGGAKKLHNKMLENVLKSPMSFFDTTPQGRILNRFGKDVDVLDTTMPMILRGWITCLLAVIATFGLISYTTPIFLLPLIVISICYLFVQRIYVATSRELKRLESVSRSPIYSHFGETVNGVQTIRAYNLQKSFIDESETKVDNNQKANYPSVVANRWLSVRLESVGNLIIFMSTLFAVLNRDTLSPGLIGLSITYALSVTQTLNWLVRMTAEVETNIVAVERLKEYAETETEAAWSTEKGPPGAWPSKGVITFDNYSTRYREGQDLVLHDLSFKVSGGERVGIVGRTGAGKSSLTLALFRIVEPASGSIYIDDVSIADLGLHELRSQLTIIPQDPVLFSGTLRINLDPFSAYSDDQVWRALELAHLKEFVTGLADGLEYGVTEGGENLSVGQRQLVCLARALLKKTKILVLDEATAAVDMETDELIQATIRKEFSDCTILTIAHRLNTIIDYDKILVLDAGRKKEYDAPQNLLQDKTSIFYELCKEAGIA